MPPCQDEIFCIIVINEKSRQEISGKEKMKKTQLLFVQISIVKFIRETLYYVM